ncbi:hypothetical protein ACLI09_04760 [Flavobacterium sp. RHBU_24]|uniref:hypothetical protein n=1 Tax=Flavobacterium sp. RHBU_24 TaxID=3391185 RepID=UPI003984B3A2
MKKILFLLAVIIGLVGCNNNDNDQVVNNSVIGQWQLVAILADPGDGSGTFITVDSQKRLTFNDDGTLNSNGNICSMDTATDVATNGTYSEENHTITGSCGVAPYPITFEFDSNGSLILNHPCIEPCRERYARIIID